MNRVKYIESMMNNPENINGFYSVPKTPKTKIVKQYENTTEYYIDEKGNIKRKKKKNDK